MWPRSLESFWILARVADYLTKISNICLETFYVSVSYLKLRKHFLVVPSPLCSLRAPFLTRCYYVPGFYYFCKGQHLTTLRTSSRQTRTQKMMSGRAIQFVRFVLKVFYGSSQPRYETTISTLTFYLSPPLVKSPSKKYRCWSFINCLNACLHLLSVHCFSSNWIDNNDTNNLVWTIHCFWKGTVQE